jgi:hypothetical protein
MLYFNYEEFDFWKVYDSIKRFYPIGIKKDESRLYYSYAGLKELELIIVDNIHDDKHFEERWGSFTKEVATQIGKEVVGTTYGQAPSFSSFVLLEQTFLDNLTRTKQLHFFVSLVGPFYTIIGEDLSTVKIEEKHYRSTSYLVVSPEGEFADTFLFLCDRIEQRFKNYRFIPFELCRQTIDGLDVHYSDEHLNKVFYALFNDHIELDIWRTIGDNYYKSGDWIKEGYVDEGGGWTSYPPTE